MILNRLTTLRKSKTSIQREGQVRQGCLSVCPKFRKDAKPKKHTQTLPYKYFHDLLASHKLHHPHNHYKRTIIPRPTSVHFYLIRSITHQSVHRLIRQPLEQLHRKTGTKRRNNSTLPCADYREIKQQQ